MPTNPFSPPHAILRSYYREMPKKFEVVTASHQYQDGGKVFASLNDDQPIEFELIFTGLTPTEGAIFDDHFDSVGYTDSFIFDSKAGVRYSEARYKNESYDNPHKGNQSWIQSRTMTIVYNPGDGTKTIVDADAQTYIDKVEESDALTAGQETAINTFVLGLKSNSLWTSMEAIYPFMGGSATAHKWNLKDVTEYIIDWEGTVTHDSNGITGNGSDGAGRTNLVPSVDLTAGDYAFGVYSRTDSQISGIDIGCKASGASRYTYIRCRYTDGSMYVAFASTGNSTQSVSNSLGFFVCSGYSSDLHMRQNATSWVKTQTVGAEPDIEFALLANADTASTASLHSNRNLSFAFISNVELSEAQTGTLQTLVEQLQDDLSRGVVA